MALRWFDCERYGELSDSGRRRCRELARPAQPEGFESPVFRCIEHSVQVTCRSPACEPGSQRIEDRYQDQGQEGAGEQSTDDDDRKRSADERPTDSTAT